MGWSLHFRATAASVMVGITPEGCLVIILTAVKMGTETRSDMLQPLSEKLVQGVKAC